MVGKQISHRDQLDVGVGVECLRRRSRPAPAATDQADPQNIAAADMHIRGEAKPAGQAHAGGRGYRSFQKGSTRRRWYTTIRFLLQGRPPHKLMACAWKGP